MDYSKGKAVFSQILAELLDLATQSTKETGRGIDINDIDHIIPQVVRVSCDKLEDEDGLEVTVELGTKEQSESISGDLYFAESDKFLDTFFVTIDGVDSLFPITDDLFEWECVVDYIWDAYSDKLDLSKYYPEDPALIVQPEYTRDDDVIDALIYDYLSIISCVYDLPEPDSP